MKTETPIAEMDTEAELDPAGAPPAPEPPRTRGRGWILLAGLAAAIPSGWLLAYLAALPFLLGIFFFVLLGLIVGAIMFRVGSKSPPLTLSTIWLLGSFVAGVMILTSLWAEYQALPGSLEKRVRQSYAESFSDRPADLARLKQGVRQHLASEFTTNYPPGGFAGYLRWAATNGKLSCPRILKASSVEYRLPHRRTLWAVRVGLSILMAEWTIVSQLFGLRIRSRKESTDEFEADAGRQDS